MKKGPKAKDKFYYPLFPGPRALQLHRSFSIEFLEKFDTLIQNYPKCFENFSCLIFPFSSLAPFRNSDTLYCERHPIWSEYKTAPWLTALQIKQDAPVYIRMVQFANKKSIFFPGPLG